MSVLLPPLPNLGQYRKQAKELVKSAANADIPAWDRIRQHHPRWRSGEAGDLQNQLFKLADAQLVIAREHGFESWPKFAKQVTAALADLQVAISLQPFKQSIALQAVDLNAEIFSMENAKAVVVLAHASGTNRYHPHSRYVAAALNSAAMCTISLDLLTEDEELAGTELELDMSLLAARLAQATDWIAQQAQWQALPLGYWGTFSGAAAALCAAGERSSVVKAVVSSGGRPDLAGPFLWKVKAPTLLVTASSDSVVIGFARTLLLAPPASTSVYSLKLVDGAKLRCDDAAVRAQVAQHARAWFEQHLLR